MIRIMARRCGVLSFALLASSEALAALVPPPPVVSIPAVEARVPTPATPARTALAKQLVGYTQPKDLMLNAVLTGYERGAAEQGGNDLAALDAIQPGLGARLADRGKAELVALVAERIPQMHERLATLFAANCTEEELKSLIAFYSSPAGAKMIRGVTMSDRGGDSFDDEKLTAQEATSVNKAAARDVAKSLDGEEWLAMIKFATSPGGRAAKALGPQVQAISAEWMTQLMADFGKRIEPIVEQMVTQAAQEADKKPGGH